MSRYARGSEPALPGVGTSTVDLHAHTARSDGVLQPDEFVMAAWAAGIRTLAITDHDNLAAYREIAAGVATMAPELTLLSGVEINAVTPMAAGLKEREIHVLGYGMDPDDEAFEAVLAGQRSRRRTRFALTVGRLREIGCGVDAQVADLDATRDDALGRPTLARALVAAGHARSVDDAFARILGAGMPGYVAREGIGPGEAIAAIRAAGGISALAHFGEAPARLDVVVELVEHGLVGLEVHYRRFDAATVMAVGEVATSLGLIATGGSDYHGDNESYVEAHASLAVPDEVGTRLRATLAGR